jgi:hypothetical protein
MRRGVKGEEEPEGAYSSSLKYAFADIYDWCDQLFNSDLNMNDCSPRHHTVSQECNNVGVHLVM